MNTYGTIIDLLIHQGPGLQDYVTADQLNQLIDGTLAPAVIADEYLAELDDSIEAGAVTVTASADENRTELLSWIRGEIDNAIAQREEAAADAAFDKLVNFDKRSHAEKMRLIATASKHHTKAAIAANLGISRPTYDKLLRDQEDRALFDAALFRLIRNNVNSVDGTDNITDFIAIRSTTTQAEALLKILGQTDRAKLKQGHLGVLDRAEKRAREIVGQ